jgi:hypothetical protein
VTNQQAFTTVAPPAAYSGNHNQLDFAIRQVMAGMATTTLVQVRAVRPKDGGYEVDVQPMVAQVDGAGNAVEHGTIHGMPVWRVQGGTSAVIVEPAVGDIGVAVFCSSDVSGVKRAKAPTTPGSYRKFDWGDGIYLGGLFGTPTQFVRMDAAGVTISSPVAVTIDTPIATFTGAVVTGAGSTFGGKAFDTHGHTGVSTGGGTSGPPS